MSEDKKTVWIIDSESVEEKVRSELDGSIEVVGFRNAAYAIDALRKGRNKPAIILGNYQAADVMLEVLHRPNDYSGIRTAYLSELDLSHLAECHNAEYVRFGSVGSFVEKH